MILYFVHSYSTKLVIIQKLDVMEHVKKLLEVSWLKPIADDLFPNVMLSPEIWERAARFKWLCHAAALTQPRRGERFT